MKQTKPFIVEIKSSRRVKPGAPKPSIWGNLDLKVDAPTPTKPRAEEGLTIPVTRDGP